MKFVQFFQPSAIDNSKTIEASGDRSVVILDGRNSRLTHEQIASEECKKRGYIAWQLWQGETFTRSSSYGPVVHI